MTIIVSERERREIKMLENHAFSVGRVIILVCWWSKKEQRMCYEEFEDMKEAKKYGHCKATKKEFVHIFEAKYVTSIDRETNTRERDSDPSPPEPFSSQGENSA